MIEKTIRDYLITRLQDPVWMERPERAPERYYLIEKTGAKENNKIRQATIAVQSYAPRMEEASAMNDAIIEEMLLGLIRSPEISSVGLNSDYNYTDTTAKGYRYQAVFEVVHY